MSCKQHPPNARLLSEQAIHRFPGDATDPDASGAGRPAADAAITQFAGLPVLMSEPSTPDLFAARPVAAPVVSSLSTRNRAALEVVPLLPSSFVRRGRLAFASWYCRCTLHQGRIGQCLQVPTTPLWQQLPAYTPPKRPLLTLQGTSLSLRCRPLQCAVGSERSCFAILPSGTLKGTHCHKSQPLDTFAEVPQQETQLPASPRPLHPNKHAACR